MRARSWRFVRQRVSSARWLRACGRWERSQVRGAARCACPGELRARDQVEVEVRLLAPIVLQERSGAVVTQVRSNSIRPCTERGAREAREARRSVTGCRVRWNCRLCMCLASSPSLHVRCPRSRLSTPPPAPPAPRPVAPLCGRGRAAAWAGSVQTRRGARTAGGAEQRCWACRLRRRWTRCFCFCPPHARFISNNFLQAFLQERCCSNSGVSPTSATGRAPGGVGRRLPQSLLSAACGG